MDPARVPLRQDAVTPTTGPETDGAHPGGDYAWPEDPLESAWCGRFRDLNGLRSFAERLPSGPQRDFVHAFLDHRAGRTYEAFRVVERLVQEQPFDPLWTARLDQLNVALLHGLGLHSQALEAAQRGLVSARACGNPTALFYALHVYGVVLERTDGRRTQTLYRQVVDLIDAVEDAPEHARDELEALRGVAVFNAHLLTDRTGLPLLPGTPGLPETQQRLTEVWPPLAVAIRAFRGIAAFSAGDVDRAREILRDLPHPGTLHDAPRSVIVATGISVFLTIEGRHEEAITLADELLGSVPPEFVPEALVMKARVYENQGDFEKAYAAAMQVVDAQGRLYGAEAQKTVRALEVYYRADQHREAADAARRQSEVIAALADEWLERSLRDPLTDLWNRRHLQRVVEQFGETTGQQLALVDIDAFKEVNDRFGHPTGDRALVHVADALRSVCAPGDIVVRYGGDEFIVVRPATDPRPLAQDLAHLCRRGLVPGHPFAGITVSVGVTVIDTDGFAAALARADSAMYEAKRHGGCTVRPG